MVPLGSAFVNLGLLQRESTQECGDLCGLVNAKLLAIENDPILFIIF
jgi:hypothetical protein